MQTATPSARQLDYQDWEFGVFLHFGIRTFYEGHRDWDGKPMEAAAFAPTALDCNQWAATAAQAGATYMVLTAKHHDGFANWPSAYTDFSVAASPWRGGCGDVVGEFVAACRAHGLRPGLYYSPADASCPVYHDPVAYDDYFIRQVSELLEPYGPIDILWFDGCGSAGHTYDWERICGEIRRLQPEILIFSLGDPDFRWVGNELGLAPQPCPNTVVGPACAGDRSGGLRWLPAECDCRMRRQNWFYSDSDSDTVKSVDELMGLYYYSVGRGCNLLLNIGPDRRGLLPQPDASRLLAFGAEIRRRFSSPVVSLAEGHRDGDSLVWEFAEPVLVDHAVICEDLSRGEHVDGFFLEVNPDHQGRWIRIWQGDTLGHKAICRFPAISVRCLRFRGLPPEVAALRSLDLFFVGDSRGD